jgi:hypothetical protein
MIFPEKRTKGQLQFQVSFLERKKKRSFALQAGRLAKVNQESFLLLVKGVDF